MGVGKKGLVAGGLWLVGLTVAAGYGAAQNWPSFRGDRALGVVNGVKLPSSWDLKSGTNVAWNVAVPGLAHSSPVVWGDRIYLTTAISADPNSVLQFPLDGKLDTRTDTAKHQFRVIAIDRKTGKTIWDKLAYEAEPKIARHPHSSYAAPTAATDGKHVVAFFGSEGLYTFDMDGKLLWKIPFATPYDQNSVTPVVAGELVIFGGVQKPTFAVTVTGSGAEARFGGAIGLLNNDDEPES